jgi:hypothetical protein
MGGDGIFRSKVTQEAMCAKAARSGSMWNVILSRPCGTGLAELGPGRALWRSARPLPLLQAKERKKTAEGASPYLVQPM